MVLNRVLNVRGRRAAALLGCVCGLGWVASAAHGDVVAYASIEPGQTPRAHYAMHPSLGIMAAVPWTDGVRIGSPFVPTQSGGITEIGAWLYAGISIDATLEVYASGAGGLPGALLGTFNVTPSLGSFFDLPITQAPPTRATGDGSVALVAGERYFLVATAMRTPEVSMSWFLPVEVPGGGTTPVGLAVGTPGPGGLDWVVGTPTDATRFWNPVGFWVTVPAPGAAALLLLGGAGAVRRRR